MMKLFYCCFILLSFGYINQGYYANVKSRYNGKVDSLTYTINGVRRITVTNLSRNIDTIISYDGKGLYEKNISAYWALYKNGRKVDSIFQFNDLGGWSHEMTILITDSLTLEEQFPNLKN